MPLPNPNPYEFTPKGKEALDSMPLQLRTPKGVRERLRRIPNWQDKLRERILLWLDEWEQGSEQR
jgi:hypothetical protein